MIDLSRERQRTNSSRSLFGNLPADPADAAVELARRGFKVFPCNPANEEPWTGEGGFCSATNDVRVVEGWFKHTPAMRGALIGFPTGLVNGVALVSIEIHNAREREGILKALAERGIVPSKAYRVRTPRGGLHLYFRCPVKGLKSRNFTGAGVELKADGEYVIAPPSRRVDGRRWEVVASVAAR